MNIRALLLIFSITILKAFSANGEVPLLELSIDGLDLVWVAPGVFTEGANGDSKNPSRLTHIKEGYWMSTTEITQKLYETITHTNPSFQKGETHPVETVTWHDAVAFARLLTEYARTLPHFPEGYVFRLPTSTEWEYAARGGQKFNDSFYAGSDKLNEVGWGRDETPQEHRPVGGKLPNALGIYDMSGNVWEWCIDALPPDRTGKPKEQTKIKRGGSFYNNGAAAYVTNYGEMAPDQKGQRFGFRLILAKPYSELP